MRYCKRGHPRTPENTLARGRCRLCANIYRRERYANDPELRERILAQHRERYKDPEYRREVRRKQSTRYHQSEAFRERQKARSRAYIERHSATGELQEYRRIAARARRARKGIVAQELRHRKRPRRSPPSEFLPAEPFTTWLRAWFAAGSGRTLDSLAVICQVSIKGVEKALRGEQKRLSLETIDRILVKTGEYPNTLHALYPIKTLHDDGTGFFLSGWDGEPGADLEVVLPPALVDDHIRPSSKSDQPWEPPEGMFSAEHLALLLDVRSRMRGWKKR